MGLILEKNLLISIRQNLSPSQALIFLEGKVNRELIYFFNLAFHRLTMT